MSVRTVPFSMTAEERARFDAGSAARVQELRKRLEDGEKEFRREIGWKRTKKLLRRLKA